MDQMTTSARSTDSGLGNYPANVMDGGSGNEHQVLVGSPASARLKPHQIWGRNVLSKEGRAGGPLIPLDCLLMSSSLSFPASPTPRFLGSICIFAHLPFWSYVTDVVSRNYL